jgi:hypothetical protein
MSANTYSNNFNALMKDAWARKTDDQSLRDNLYNMLQANWSSFTPEEISVVRGYIERIDRWKLDSAIRQAAMATGRPAVPTNPSPFSHCVRCHASFVAGDLDDPCRIPHVVDDKKAERIVDDLYFTSKCCGADAIASLKWTGNATAYVNVGPQKNCIEGVHTTNALAVEFLKRQKPGCNGMNIFPCQLVDGRCVRRAVRYTEGTFVREQDFSLRRI